MPTPTNLPPRSLSDSRGTFESPGRSALKTHYMTQRKRKKKKLPGLRQPSEFPIMSENNAGVFK